MVKAFNPYSVFAAQLMHLLDESRSQKNPAFWLYSNKARNPLFMLESIARIMYKSTGDPKSKKWRKVFKQLEDILGKIDVYDSYYTQFKKNKNIAKEFLDYLIQKRDKAVKKFNYLLLKNDYYKKFMILFMRSCKADFNKKDLILKFEKHIQKEVNDSEVFFDKFPMKFTDLESQVHELRRKLRWLSIYCQSLQGMIVLKDPGKKYPWELKFTNREARSSPFLKLPKKQGLERYIIMNKTVFIALNHVIEELGNLKDKGIAIEFLEKSIKKNKGPEKVNSEVLAIKLLRSPFDIEAILAKAHILLFEFFKTYKIHRSLIAIR